MENKKSKSGNGALLLPIPAKIGRSYLDTGKKYFFHTHSMYLNTNSKGEWGFNKKKKETLLYTEIKIRDYIYIGPAMTRMLRKQRMRMIERFIDKCGSRKPTRKVTIPGLICSGVSQSVGHFFVNHVNWLWCLQPWFFALTDLKIWDIFINFNQQSMLNTNSLIIDKKDMNIYLLSNKKFLKFRK